MRFWRKLEEMLPINLPDLSKTSKNHRENKLLDPKFSKNIKKPFSKSGKNPNPRGQQKKKRVKTAKKRSHASTRWLQRQLNDPYVAEAQAQGYRSRAAFKLVQLDEQLNLIKKGQNIIDLGAAPGGWTQIIVDKVKVFGELYREKKIYNQFHQYSIQQHNPIEFVDLHYHL